MGIGLAFTKDVMGKWLTLIGDTANGQIVTCLPDEDQIPDAFSADASRLATLLARGVDRPRTTCVDDLGFADWERRG